MLSIITGILGTITLSPTWKEFCISFGITFIVCMIFYCIGMYIGYLLFWPYVDLDNPTVMKHKIEKRLYGE